MSDSRKGKSGESTKTMGVTGQGSNKLTPVDSRVGKLPPPFDPHAQSSRPGLPSAPPPKKPAKLELPTLPKSVQRAAVNTTVSALDKTDPEISSLVGGAIADKATRLDIPISHLDEVTGVDGKADEISERATNLEIPTISDADLDELFETLMSDGGGGDFETTAFSQPSGEDVFEGSEELSTDYGLEASLSLSDDLRAAIDEYDEEIRAAKPGISVNVAAIHLAVARLLDHAGFEKQVYARNLKALERNPASIAAIRELRRIARAYGNWKDVGVLLESELKLAISDSRRAILLEELARLRRFSPENAAEVKALLHQVIAMFPDRISPRDVLMVESSLEGDWGLFLESSSVLESLIKDAKKQAGLSLNQAAVRQYKLDDDLGATSAYLQTLSWNPASLSSVLALLPLLYEQERWDVCFKMLQSFTQKNDDNAINYGLYFILAAIGSAKLERQQAAIESLERASQIESNDVLALELLRDLYLKNRSYWRDLNATYQRLIELQTDPKSKAELSIMRADAVMRLGEDPLGAIEILRMAYDASPRSQDLLRELSALLKQYGQLEDYARYETILAEQSEGLEAADCYADLGMRILESAGPESEYLKCFERALQCYPGHRTAFESLERIYRDRGRFKDLIRIYEFKLSVTQSLARRAMLLKTMAVIYEYSLNQPQAAIEVLKEYRRIYPDDLEALRSLQRIYLSIRQWPQVLELYAEELRFCDDKFERNDLYMRMADVCERNLHRVRESLEFTRRAIQEAPELLYIYERLARKLARADMPGELVAHYESYKDLVDNERKEQILCEMGELSYQRLGKTNEAVVWFEDALALNPRSNRAFYGLSEIYDKTKQWSAYVELVLRRTQHIESVSVRVAMLYRVAVKYVFELELLRDAERLLRKAQELAPHHIGVAALLDMVLTLNAEWPALCVLLESFVNTELRSHTKAELSYRLASIYVWHDDNFAAAVQPLELALALSNDLAAARFALIYSLIKQNKYNDISALFYEAAQGSEDTEFAISLCRSAADMAHYDKSIPQKDDLHIDEVSALRRILELDPNDAVAVERLEAMNPKRAQLMTFWEKRLPTAQGDEVVELKLSIAEVLFPSNPQKAFKLISEAVEESPQHMPAVRMAANTALTLNNYMLACRYRAEEGKRLLNIDHKIKAYRESANIALKMLKRSDIAIHNLRQAFLIAPYDQGITNELLKLYEMAQDWQNMSQLLSMHSNYLSNEDKISRYMQMAKLYLEPMNEPQQAVVKLRQLLELDHDNIPALELLAKVETSLEHWSEARYAYLSLLEERVITPEKRREYRVALAKLLSEHLAKPQQAAKLLLAQIEENPQDVEMHYNLATLYAEEGESQKSLQIYSKISELLPAPKNIEALLRMASIYRSINELDKLNETLLTAVKLVPLDATVLESLEQWFLQCDDPSVILAFVQELLQLTGLDSETMVRIYTFVFNCYSGPLRMRFEADKYALAAAQLAPNNAAAQLLAARVFDPKEAFTYAFNAMALDPFNPDVYRTIFHIAETVHRIDLQARAEQSLIVLGASARKSSAHQNAFTMRYPERFVSPTLEQMKAMAPDALNRWALELLRKAGAQAQIFALPAFPSETLHPNTRFSVVVKSIAECMGMSEQAVHVGPIKKVFSLKHDEPEILVFNSSLVEQASEAEQRFHVASAFCSLKLGSTFLRILESKDIFRLFNGLLGLAHEQYGEPDIVKRLSSFLARKDRRAVIEHVKSVAVEQIQIDAQTLQGATFMTENRVGLLYCADLDAAITGLMRINAQGANPSYDPHQRILQLPHLPGALDLLTYNLSYAFEDLRKELGMAIHF
ncbi:MAG: hypothetical protein WC966_11230 [Bradymonadales bacterium]